MWMNDCNNMTALAHMPDKLCLWDKLYKKHATSLLLPFTMSGFRHRNRKNKAESKGERCFYLNTSSDHSSTTHKILLPREFGAILQKLLVSTTVRIS